MSGPGNERFKPSDIISDSDRWLKFNNYIEQNKRPSETGQTIFHVDFNGFGTEADREWFLHRKNNSKRELMALNGLQLNRRFRSGYDLEYESPKAFSLLFCR